jgi:hypothetical protein
MQFIEKQKNEKNIMRASELAKLVEKHFNSTFAHLIIFITKK